MSLLPCSRSWLAEIDYSSGAMRTVAKKSRAPGPTDQQSTKPGKKKGNGDTPSVSSTEFDLLPEFDTLLAEAVALVNIAEGEFKRYEYIPHTRQRVM